MCMEQSGSFFDILDRWTRFYLLKMHFVYLEHQHMPWLRYSLPLRFFLQQGRGHCLTAICGVQGAACSHFLVEQQFHKRSIPLLLGSQNSWNLEGNYSMVFWAGCGFDLFKECCLWNCELALRKCMQSSRIGLESDGSKKWIVPMTIYISPAKCIKLWHWICQLLKKARNDILFFGLATCHS